MKYLQILALSVMLLANAPLPSCGKVEAVSLTLSVASVTVSQSNLAPEVKQKWQRGIARGDTSFSNYYARIKEHPEEKQDALRELGLDVSQIISEDFVPAGNERWQVWMNEIIKLLRKASGLPPLDTTEAMTESASAKPTPLVIVEPKLSKDEVERLKELLKNPPK